ncbi:MAG: glycosyltransferase [Halodesulfurarchaeum sp.]|nr:glycosyltransferase [Halodesulfurarchaeum sp.]
MTVKYSITSTHYNNNDFIRESAGVFADLIEGKDDWELVISDAGSNDGSLSYLRELEADQSNVRIVMAEEASIGKGRQIAFEHSRGDVIISLGDLDASYYEDERLLDVVEFYEDLREREGDILLGGPVMIGSRTLISELGGWNDLWTTERRDLKRRALRAEKLRFVDFSIVKSHPSQEKGFSDAFDRFYTNARMKLKTGMTLSHLVAHWLRNAPGLKPKIGAIIVFPTAWLHNRLVGTERLYTFDPYDPYALDFQRSVQRENPDIWLEPIGPLAKY